MLISMTAMLFYTSMLNSSSSSSPVDSVTVCNFVGQSIDDFLGLAFLSLSLDFVGDEAEQFLLGDVEAGTVTPGITGKFAGGVLARGD